MYMSILWETIFEMKEKYPFIEIYLIDNFVPLICVGRKEDATLYISGFSQEEWQGSIISLKFLNELLECITNETEMSGVPLEKALKGKGIAFIPCICPKSLCEIDDSATGILPVTKYCIENKIGSIYVLKAQGESVFSGENPIEKDSRSSQIRQVISACGKLPVKDELDNSAEARFCRWSSSVLEIPSFLIELGVTSPSQIDYAYENKKETLLITAII